MGRAPGQGVRCGDSECHKYASCAVTFHEQEEQSECKCPEGLHGDGITSCEHGIQEQTEPQTAAPDCRTGPGCGPNADCVYLETGSFACQCRYGFQGHPALLICREVDEYEPE